MFTRVFKGRLAGIGVGEYTSSAHKQLDHAVGDVEGLAAVLGSSFEGEPLRNPSEAEARDYLGQLPDSLPADSALVVAWSGHASLPAAGGLRLLAKDSGTRASSGLGLTDVVLFCAESGANQVLFVFDTCFSGDAISADDLATLIMRDAQAAGQVWVGVVTSCLPLEKARDGLFGRRLRKVLAEGPDLPELRMRWSVHNQYVRGDDVCDAVLKEWGSGAQTPDFRSRGSAWWMFRNPLYEAGAPERVVEHLLRAARSGASVDEQSWFTGRTAEVNQVVEWVREGLPGVRVVTGSAGTGKSAILGRVVSLSNPEERDRLLREGREWSHVLPEERSVAAHVHARGLTADLAADQFAGQLVRAGLLPAREARRNASELVGEVQRAVEEGALPPVLVMDGLDEARGEAFKIADELLNRVAPYAVVVVSTRDMQRGEEGRPGLVGTLAPEGVGIDLDDPVVQSQGLEDLREYVRRRLGAVDQRMDAGAVAEHLFVEDADEVQHTFLLARLVADQLSAAPVDTSVEGWEDKVSHSVEEALDADLAAIPNASVALAKSILRALTWAYGAGFPEQEWLVVANVEAPDGMQVTREDISWVLEQLGRHVVQDGEGGVAVYRMAHQSLADHLRPRFRESAEEPFNPQALEVAEALLGLYQEHLRAGLPAEVPFYLWLHAWHHAADAGADGLALMRSLAENAALLPDIGIAAAVVSARLQHWGHAVRALSPAEESADVFRALAEDNPGYVPNLADALNNLSSRYSSIGRHIEAQQTAEEALSLYDELAKDNPVYRSELANALNNLGVRYSNLGRPHDALPPAEEAIAIYRTLADTSSAHQSNLAMALNNLGAHYSNLGRPHDALPPAEEAVTLNRTLADTSSAYLPDLAMALNNLGIRYSELGRPADALPPTEEAVRIRRVLTRSNPAHMPDLANALNNLGVRYTALGRPHDALPPTQEAVTLNRTLADTNPAHIPDLAMALTNLGNRYSNLGRPRDALPPTEEAIGIYRTLADTNPAYLPDLADALNNLGVSYSELGRPADGLPPIEEAVAIYRALADTNPAYLPYLASALNNLGIRYSELGRPADGLPPTQEAVRIRRGLADTNPAYLPDLANALNNLGVRFTNLGRPRDALPPTEEAIAIYRTLTDTNPAHLPNLANALNNLGIRYSELGRPADALPPTQEAVTLNRTLADTNPAYLPNLATALNNLGVRFDDLKRPHDALPPTEEAIAIYRTLTDTNPGRLPDLAMALHNLGAHYSSLGRPHDALPPAEEAIAIYRTLIGTNPGRLPDLAMALHNLDSILSAVGKSVDAKWATVLGQISRDDADRLLLHRSSYARPGDPRAVVWLVKVEQSAATAENRERLWNLHFEARRHRAADNEAFDREWHRLTQATPAWLALEPNLLKQAEAWIGTETYDAERDYLAAHPKLLAPEADIYVEEALLVLQQEDFTERYRALRRTAQREGVDAAYRPLLSSVLAHEFARSGTSDQRALLEQRRENLLDRHALDSLSDRTDHMSVRAASLLKLAQVNAEAGAFAALDDPPLFRSLLHDAARQPDLAVLEATALLALTAATDEQLAAEAQFHLAIAVANSNTADAAADLLTGACDRTPTQIPTWITSLAEIAPHHPAALTLIPHLTARLQKPEAGHPNDH